MPKEKRMGNSNGEKTEKFELGFKASVSISVATAIATWAVCQALYVQPRNHEIETLKESLRQSDAVASSIKNQVTVLEERVEKLLKEKEANKIDQPMSRPQASNDQRMNQSPGAILAGRDVHIEVGKKQKQISEELIGKLIRLRRQGDSGYAELLKLDDDQNEMVLSWIENWERNVEYEVSKVSQVALNVLQTSRSRRTAEGIHGRGFEYTGYMQRLKFQTEALTSIISSN